MSKIWDIFVDHCCSDVWLWVRKMRVGEGQHCSGEGRLEGLGIVILHSCLVGELIGGLVPEELGEVGTGIRRAPGLRELGETDWFHFKSDTHSGLHFFQEHGVKHKKQKLSPASVPFQFHRETPQM